MDIWLILIGFFVGTVGTLIGAGGGFILMPFLLLMYPSENAQNLTAISLAVIFMNTVSGSISYAFKRRIDYRSVIIFSIAGAPGALLGAYAIGFFPREQFNILFGGLLGLVSMYLLVNPKKMKPIDHLITNSKYPVRTLVDSTGHEYIISYNQMVGVIISIGVGFISSFLGIGGGIIHVPAMVNILDFPVHIAIATSHSILAVMSAIGTGEHIIAGHLDHSWSRILLLAPGVILGAQLGAYLSPKMKDTWIIKGLAFALMMVALRFILS